MKKFRFVTRMILFLFTVGFMSCGNDDESPTEQETVEENYIPYSAVGNIWNYQVTPESGQSYQATIKVDDMIVENNVEMAVVKEQSSKNINDFSLIYYEITDVSLLVHKIADYDTATGDTSFYDFSPAATWLELPFEKDDEWQIFKYRGDPTEIPLVGSGFNLDSSFAQYTIDLTLNGSTVKKEGIKAANENFQAYKVEFTYLAKIDLTSGTVQLPGRLAAFWFVPYVGIVKIEFYDFEGNVMEQRIMESYNLL